MLKLLSRMPRFSPLRFRVWDSCRLRYRYQYVERARPRLRPADTAGSLVHRVLCDYFSKVGRADRSEERLLAMFDAGWEALSARYRQMPGAADLRQAAISELRNFGRCHDLAAQPFALEAYLQTEVAPGIILFGRIDRIDEDADGSLQIIDYKTGADADELDARQLPLYAIIIERELDRRVSKASFWYLEDGRVWTTSLSTQDKRRALEEMLSTIQQMNETGDFPATIGRQCGYCPYLHCCEQRDEIERRRAAEGW